MTIDVSTPDFERLAAYWLGELDPVAEEALEEQIFADAALAARLDVIATLGTALVSLAREGKLQGAVTMHTVEKLRAAGLVVREYTLAPGQVVPCTIGAEDLMIIRLQGTFEGVTSVDVDLEWRLEGEAPRVEALRDVPVDQHASGLVLVYPGDGIRALPRAGFTYRVSTAGAPHALGEFHLEHTPPAT